MANYYSDSLNAKRLQKCYAIAPKRVKQFLKAEITFVLDRTNADDIVLDLGCGYGRVSARLLKKAKSVAGIDISKENIQLAEKFVGNAKNCKFYEMDAIDLKFNDGVFDFVICIQNGISAFKVDPESLLKEAIRVTRRKGIILFSSYSEKFGNTG
ncbi:MAG: class I SAM-dependent methyltransferase [Bacteroidales bacterium]